MSQEYIAFISYNKGDSKAAALLQKTIENYVIPKKFRVNNQNHLGKVFRDKDELDLTENLPEAIQEAMKNSEYLIVLCSSKSAQSQWVSREISYFLDLHNHDHSRIIPVLLEGYGKDTIPELLLEDNGTDYEVLAVDLTNVPLHPWNREYQSETLRLIACLLGCSYPELVDREKQRKLVKWVSYMSLFSAVLLAFCLVLINRNNEITKKNQEILYEESAVLSALSSSSLEDHDRHGAISQAYTALPKNDDRPYYSGAEMALTDSLALYLPDEVKCSFSLPSSLYGDCYLSSDGSSMAVYSGENQTLHCIGIETGKELWTLTDTQVQTARFFPDGKTIAIASPNDIILLDTEDGNCVGEYRGYSSEQGTDRVFFSDCLNYAAVVHENDRVLSVSLLDGTCLAEKSNVTIQLNKTGYSCEVVFSCDDAYFAVLLSDFGGQGETQVYIADTHSGKVIDSLEFLPVTFDIPCRGTFSPDYRFLVSAPGEEEGTCTVHAFTLNGNCEEIWHYTFPYQSVRILTPKIFQPESFFSMSENYTYIANGNTVTILDNTTGAPIHVVQVGGYIVGFYLFPESDNYMLTLYDGIVTLGTATGLLGYELNISYFDVKEKLLGSTSSGTGYLNYTTLVETTDNSIVVYNNFEIPEMEEMGKEDGDALVETLSGISRELLPELAVEYRKDGFDITDLELLPEYGIVFGFTENGHILVFDAGTKEELSDIDLSAYDWPDYACRDDTSYKVFLLPDDRFLIVAESEFYDLPIDVVVRKERWEPVEVHFGIHGYCTDTKKLVLQSYLEKFYECDYLSLEDKMAIAEHFTDFAEENGGLWPGSGA